MKRNIVTIYAFTVCFISILCGVVVLGLFGYNIVKAVAPDFTFSTHELRTLSSNDEFRYFYRHDRYIPEGEEKITQLRKQEYRFLVDAKRREGLQRLLFYGIIFIIDLAMYTTHWKIGVKNLARTSGDMEQKALNPS